MIPPVPLTQGLSSSTFTRPPVDGSLFLTELYEWHYNNSPNHPFFIYAKDDGTVQTVTWSDVVRGMYVGTEIVRNIMGWTPGMKEVPVIAVISVSETISYFMTLLSISRAGYILFPISPRNSPAAIAHLISKVGVKHIFRGSEPSMVGLTAAGLQALKAADPTFPLPTVSAMPVYQDFFSSDAVPTELPFYERKGPEDLLLYIHSSGSTAHPKPIPSTYKQFMQVGVHPYFGGQDLCDKVLSLHTIPMFHGLGIAQLIWPATTGLVLSVFEPKSPAVMPTPQSHFVAAKKTESDIMFCVPVILEAWSKNSEYVEWIASRTGVLYGGGPLNKVAGDHLASQGVSIFGLYGSSEGGVANPIIPAKPYPDWDYFPWSDNVTAEMVPRGDGLYELIYVENPHNQPRVFNTKIRGLNAYASADLFQPHPTLPGYWRVYGRVDDQIMHSTGEKTNAAPLESILNQDPHIQSTVMFGRGRFQAGVIIDPKPAFAFDPADEVKLADFRNKIWPTVQKANEFAPQHSRLFKEMVLVAKPSKPFQYTAKNTPRRQAVINEYKDEIDALYDAVESTSQADLKLPSTWDRSSVLDFIRSVVKAVIPHEIADGADIFESGCDSLQATWIRNTVLRALRQGAELDTRSLSNNFVYEYSTIERLTNFLLEFATGTSSADKRSLEARASVMNATVERYSQNFPKAKATNAAPTSSAKVILLTGTTGAFGCHLLNQLVGDSSIAKIFAVNRPRRSGQLSLPETQKKALTEKGLDAPAILDSGKVVLVEADLAQPQFGLDEKAYSEMQASVTHIIHNAWPVHFNLALASFERSIKGLRNLIDFALTSSNASSPTLLFMSTIGVCQNAKDSDAPIPETLVPAESAIGTGYSESKWVSEQVIARASQQSGLRSLIVRLGQLSGGSNGNWNVTEWFPSLVQTSIIINAFPELKGLISWIPSHKAARVVVDFVGRDQVTGTALAHLVHPQPVTWSSIASSISHALGIPLVSYNAWLRQVEAAGKDDKAGQAQPSVAGLRLLPFLRQAADKALSDQGEAMGFPRLDTVKAKELSPLMKDQGSIGQLDEKDVQKWLEYWNGVGFIAKKL